MWHETMYDVLNIINNIILMCIGIPFFLQLVYMLLFWVKKKTFKKSGIKGKVAIVYAARNEEDVIYETIKQMRDNQDYPKELYDIYVICHNCTDNTKAEAERAGAKTIVYNDPDPKTHIKAYCMNYGIDYLLKQGIEYDFVLCFDADNRCNKEYISLMNDAYQSGVKFARPYESASNMTQNCFTKACGLYYIFDSRFSSRVRERLHIGAHVNGSGMMIAYSVLKERGGFNCFSISEDAEFTLDLMDKKIFAHFVEDAVVYEDLPSTFKDTYNRNKRIGSGSIRLIFGKMGKLFLKFFYTFKFSYLEYFLTYFFNIICVLLCTWIPLFYIYDIVYLLLVTNNVIQVTANTVASYSQVLTNTWIVIVVCVSVLFVFCGFLQAFLLIMLDYKKMGAKKRSELISGMFLFPFFSVIYIITLALGVFSKPSWNKIKRNPKKKLTNQSTQ